MSSVNPKSIISIQEYGNPFEKLEEGIEHLMALAKSKGYQAQVNASYMFSGTTRYAVNQVTQPTEYGEISFALNLANGKSIGSGSTTMVNASGLDDLFTQVEKIVKGSPEVPFFQGFPDPRPGTPKELGSKDWTVEERVDTVIQAINMAEEVHDRVIVSGTASTTINYQRIVTSQGIDVETSTNGHYFKINCIVESDSDKSHRGYGQEEIHFRKDPPNIDEMAIEAATTAKDTLNLIDVPPKEYEVVLGHQAVADLMIFAQFSLEPVGFHETNSYASDRIGDQIFDQKICIDDKPLDPSLANIVRAFDGEGLPTNNERVFEKGVLKIIPYDSFNAARFLGDKNAATGHSFTFFGQTTGMFASFVLQGGKKTYGQLVEEIDNGLWVKNFWYNRFTKRREGGLTGLTRNGLYYVKNGEIQGAARNLRYTENFVRAFGPGNVISLSSDRKMFQLNTCPAAHLKAFNFSSVAHTSK